MMPDKGDIPLLDKQIKLADPLISLFGSVYFGHAK